MAKLKNINNIIVVNDQHCGCRFGLCPPVVQLDEGGTYTHTKLQAKVWEQWLYFWNVWVPAVTKGESYIVINNGDMIDGVHHGSTTQISHNMQDQRNIAIQVMKPVLSNAKCKGFYMIRGTEVHVGHSGCDEESIAKELGAVKNETGNYSRYELFMEFGHLKQLIHLTHHVGTTGSAAYESTAVFKEIVEQYNDAGRWGNKPPDVIGRAHRHRAFKIEIPTEKGMGIVFVSPGWQLKMLDLNTPIPTVNGWTTMGNIKHTDILFDENGNKCNVIEIGDININPKSYIVKFRNGEEVKACADHLWLTIAEVDKPGVPGSGNKKRPLKRVRTTQEIYDTMFYGKKKSLNHKLEMPLPLQIEEKELTINPYILGCWLGDGDSDGARMTICNEDIGHFLSEFNKTGYELNEHKTINRCPRYAIKSNNETTLRSLLASENLLNNKHIPDLYLRSSFNQRLSLLQGLMDTDGNADKLGRACFFTTSKDKLKLGVNELLASLGIKFTVMKKPSILNGEKVGEHWIFRFFISPDIFPVFRMKRKMDRIPYSTERKTAQKSRSVQIISVEPCEPVPMRCIAVDSPSHLYRFGETMLYTHNTPYVYRMPLGRAGNPQIGGVLIRDSKEDGLFTRSYVKSVGRTKTERI